MMCYLLKVLNSPNYILNDFHEFTKFTLLLTIIMDVPKVKLLYDTLSC